MLASLSEQRRIDKSDNLIHYLEHVYFYRSIDLKSEKTKNLGQFIMVVEATFASDLLMLIIYLLLSVFDSFSAKLRDRLH